MILAPSERAAKAFPSFARPVLIWLPLLMLLAGVAIVVAYESLHLTGFTFGSAAVNDYDEGVYMATAALMAHGYRLYTQIYNAQPPLFVAAILAAYRLLGEGIWQARLAVLIFAVLALLGAFGIAGLARGTVAAGGAALVLAVSPEFLVYSHAVEEEVPMMALSGLSMAFLLLWLRQRKLGWSAASGLFFALAVLTKFFAFALLAPLGVTLLIVLWDARDRRDTVMPVLSSALAFVIVAAAPFVASLLWFGPQEWSQMVSDRLHASSQSAGLQSASNVHMVLSFLSPDIGLVVLALAGGLLLLVWDWRMGLILDTWALGTLILLAAYHPLMGHHPAIVLLPAAVLAGIAVAFVLPGQLGNPATGSVHTPDAYRRSVSPFQSPQGEPASGDASRRPALPLASGRLLRVLAVSATVVYLLLLPRLVSSYSGLLVKPGIDDRSLAAAVIRSRTAPDQMVATADPLICVEADRLCVPDLVDTSYVRMATGKLSATEAITDVRRYRPAVVAMWPRFRSVEMAPFATWVHTHYRLLKAYFCPPGQVASCDALYIRR
ncbi:MAG TPA: glycosyltransferase family 39 protein [Chloroflexota bacterium]|nr:glycosyltransferase family 39 protein [Chloroflexota bacterium]